MLDHHYDGLEGDWAEYARTAQIFVRYHWASIPLDDVEDLTQRLILRMYLTSQKLGKGRGGWLWTCARFEYGHYWQEKLRERCRMVSLDWDNNGNGQPRELWETIPSPQPDLDAQIDARIWLQDCSEKVLAIGHKVVNGETLTVAEAGYMAYWRRRVGIDGPKSGHVTTSSSRAYEVQLPTLKVTLYQAVYTILARSPAPLHEKEITRLVIEAYPPLVQRIKGKFNRQIHATLCKRQRSGVFVRVGPATWIAAGKPRAHSM